jgi:hypothetical protein
MLKRDVTPEECHWLREPHFAGDIVFSYHGPTYGCISPAGIACTKMPEETPFFELPRDALPAGRRVF